MENFRIGPRVPTTTKINILHKAAQKVNINKPNQWLNEMEQCEYGGSELRKEITGTSTR
jgi:hypothetical protein